MSSQNAFPGPNTGRPVARPANPERPRQPSWVHPQAQAAQAPQANGWQQQSAPAQQGSFTQQGYSTPTPHQQTDYGQWSELQTGGLAARPDAAGHADPYAPQFEPYVPTRQGYGNQQAAPGYGTQQSPQWPGRERRPTRLRCFGALMAQAHAGPQAMQQFAHGGASFDRPYQEPDLGHGDWHSQPELGGFGQDPYSQAQGGAELGFAQPEGGELDPAYAEEDVEYEDDYAPRGRRPLKIAAALIGAILIGGGMAYGYKKMAPGGSQGEPPVIKSEASPSKTKPADAGGKQFPYSDTKIMGRLGDGTSPAAADEAHAAASSDSPSGDAASAPGDSSSASTDDGGARKVATLVVGRDGSIQSPPAEPVSDSPPTASPAFPARRSSMSSAPKKGRGTQAPSAGRSGNDHEAAPARPAAQPVTADDTPATSRKVTPVKIAKVNSASAKPAATSTTGSIEERDDAAAPPAAKKPKRVARAETTATDANPDPAPVTSSGGGSGFVAVLASVPQSATSRMDALKRFADMQQKYGTALAGKTPDVAEANLGAKGSYHRLIVGPPGSREQASAVCVQLKAEGYNGCWVTSY